MRSHIYLYDIEQYFLNLFQNDKKQRKRFVASINILICPIKTKTSTQPGMMTDGKLHEYGFYQNYFTILVYINHIFSVSWFLETVQNILYIYKSFRSTFVHITNFSNFKNIFLVFLILQIRNFNWPGVSLWSWSGLAFILNFI